MDTEDFDTFIFDNDKEFCEICYDIIKSNNKKLIVKYQIMEIKIYQINLIQKKYLFIQIKKALKPLLKQDSTPLIIVIVVFILLIILIIFLIVAQLIMQLKIIKKRILF